jgi:PPOX class probable F420-dependent enzyme
VTAASADISEKIVVPNAASFEVTAERGSASIDDDTPASVGGGGERIRSWTMAAEIPASHRSILEAPGVAVLSTVGRDGTPQSSALWYLLDGDVVRTSLAETRQKVKNLRRNPRFSLLAWEVGNPYKTVELRGEASLEIDSDRELFIRELRHYGQDPETFPDDRSTDRIKITFDADHVVTWGD